MKPGGTAARRYAEAAFQLAERDGQVEPWLAELRLAAAVLASPELLHHLEDPAVPLPERLEAIDAALGSRLSPAIRNLVLLLVRRGRAELLPAVASEYKRLHDRRAGIAHAIVTSAAPLESDERQAIETRIRELTGGRVETDWGVDASILGGVVVRIGDQLYDGSVRARLERLRSRLTAGAI